MVCYRDGRLTSLLHETKVLRTIVQYIEGRNCPMNEMKYFEICVSLNPDGTGTSNDSWRCIRGIREPSLEEAQEFCKEDAECFGGRVIGVFPIDRITAEAGYDFTNEFKWPVFGLSCEEDGD